MIRILYFTTVFIFSFSIMCTAQGPDIERLEKAVALVEIYDYNNNFTGHGSGFVIESSGVLVTNYHVVDGAYNLKIVFEENGTRVKYDVESIIKGSKSKDLAILKISNNKNKQFSYLEISKQPPKKGEECWAIGTPASRVFMNNVSKGLVSNLLFSENPKSILTNAEFAQGSSGGPLINKRGEVIGVNSAVYTSKNATRASINKSILIDEINNLPTIQKKNIIDPKSIPCEISFFTRSPYIGVAYLYVDNNYIGTFKKYFTNSTPSCNDEGTLTRTLYSGEHSYYIYYKQTGSYSSGRVSLSAGECKIYNVSPPKKQSPKITYFTPRPFGWTFFTHISGSTPYSANHFDGGPIFSFGIEKNIGNRSSLLVKFQDLAMYTSSGISQTLDGRDLSRNDEYSVNNDHMALIADLKIFSDDNLWFGPSFGLLALKKEVIDPIGINTKYPKKIGFGFGLRLGFDKFISKRLVFTSDIVLMKFNKNVIDEALHWGTVIKPTSATLNFNLGLGFRFLKTKKR